MSIVYTVKKVDAMSSPFVKDAKNAMIIASAVINPEQEPETNAPVRNALNAESVRYAVHAAVVLNPDLEVVANAPVLSVRTAESAQSAVTAIV